MIDLKKYKKNYFSQNGEDGVLEKIFELIGVKNKWCVEFGAWDGKYLSNTYNYISKSNWSAVLIESDIKKFEELKNSMSIYEEIYPINSLVGNKGESKLDNILQKTPIPKDFDLLSIDVDGNDYAIWEALDEYLPRVVVIEVDSTYLPNKDYLGSTRPDDQSSLFRMTKLALKKKYFLANHIGNAIYIKNEYESKFWSERPTLDQLFDKSWLPKTFKQKVMHKLFGKF
jgi:hypothetical protein